MRSKLLFFTCLLTSSHLLPLSRLPAEPGSEERNAPEANKEEKPSPAVPSQKNAKPVSTPKEQETATETDSLTGMIIAENWELVRNNCITCHSPQQFLRQRGNRSTWQSVVDWMQKDQGLLWLVDPKVEDKIVTYLAENYAPEVGKYRRAPIAATLMPANPYISELKKEFAKKKAKGLIPKDGPKQ